MLRYNGTGEAFQTDAANLRKSSSAKTKWNRTTVTSPHHAIIQNLHTVLKTTTGASPEERMRIDAGHTVHGHLESVASKTTEGNTVLSTTRLARPWDIVDNKGRLSDLNRLGPSRPRPFSRVADLSARGLRPQTSRPTAWLHGQTLGQSSPSQRPKTNPRSPSLGV
ncbi:hypothetical protein HJFPF1_03053 [Paramyrothecium foliicola]|nr:hypothetical protein HJFPF1_03053 [Paramyrothecium foliicola]